MPELRITSDRDGPHLSKQLDILAKFNRINTNGERCRIGKNTLHYYLRRFPPCNCENFIGCIYNTALISLIFRKECEFFTIKEYGEYYTFQILEKPCTT
jgi:hypothetical protein